VLAGPLDACVRDGVGRIGEPYRPVDCHFGPVAGGTEGHVGAGRVGRRTVGGLGVEAGECRFLGGERAGAADVGDTDRAAGDDTDGRQERHEMAGLYHRIRWYCRRTY